MFIKTVGVQTVTLSAGQKEDARRARVDLLSFELLQTQIAQPEKLRIFGPFEFLGDSAVETSPRSNSENTQSIRQEGERNGQDVGEGGVAREGSPRLQSSKRPLPESGLFGAWSLSLHR